VDASDERLFQDELRTRTTLYRMMAETNRSILRSRTREELYQSLCDIAVTTGEFRCAWVGVPDGPAIRRVAWAGGGEEYLDALVISTDPADPRSQGPTGRAARLGQAFVVNDFHDSSMTALWHDAARRVGFDASAAFPMREGGSVAAVLTLYADRPNFFTPALVETLSEITPTVSLALEAFATAAARERMATQLRQAEKLEAVGQLASGVAHDFNNILTVMTGCAELLREELAPGSAGHDLLNEIRDAGARASALTQRLLAFSRQQVVTPRTLDLDAVLREAEAMLRRLLGSDIALVHEPPPAAIAVNADPAQLEQILVNLAVNARDAMPMGGTLTIRIGPAPSTDAVLLEVADTGVGMDAVTKARLFEPFFTTKAPGHGTGIGLPTVLRLVQDLGGSISVESTLGAGTTFRILLPRTTEPVEPAAPRAETGELPRGTETILLVEDEDALRALLRRALQQCGYHVLEAANGAVAVTLARETREVIHLLVSDIVMPHLGGRQLADVICAARPSCRVLFLSGHARDEMIRRGIVDSPHTFLQKPFTVHELAQQVRVVLDG
jgi:signal transduction histidine kinase